MHQADHSSSSLLKFHHLAVNLFSPIHSFSCRPPFCSSSMLQYRSILPLLVLALGAATLSIDPASFSFAVQYNNLLNYTLPINQTNRPYYIECRNIKPRYLPAPDPEVCLEVIPTACEKLSPHFPFMVVRNEWVWTSLEGCSLAYYMPREAPRSLYPSVNECKDDIYGDILDWCTQMTGECNVGTINVLVPPDPSREGIPRAFNYPRYLLASDELDKYFDIV